jgi:hypothetical protein
MERDGRIDSTPATLLSAWTLVGRPSANRVFGVTHNIQYPCKNLFGDIER